MENTDQLHHAPPLWKRMACFLYEGMMLFGLGLIPGAVGALWYAMMSNTHIEEVESGLRIFTLGIYAAYFTWCWSRRGQTLPMQTWNILLATTSGKPLTKTHSMVRFMACWIWVIPGAVIGALIELSRWQYFGCIFIGIITYAALSHLHPYKQFWHDTLCKTQLIDTKSDFSNDSFKKLFKKK